MTQCPRHSLTGGRCELDAGHKGDVHQKTYRDGYISTWTDEGERRFIKQWEARR
jgi:hypothetical protein